jgi:pimeloyl-ACP methyl ester carboxylesterase
VTLIVATRYWFIPAGDGMKYHGPKIRVNSIDMNAVDERPDVLLVHGFPDMHKVWLQVIPALVSAGYRVIAPDTRGCGETERHVAASRSGRT